MRVYGLLSQLPYLKSYLGRSWSSLSCRFPDEPHLLAHDGPVVGPKYPLRCLRSCPVSTQREITFINDVAPSRDAYFTDSVRLILFKFEDRRSDIVGDVGELEEWLNLEGTPQSTARAST